MTQVTWFRQRLSHNRINTFFCVIRTVHTRILTTDILSTNVLCDTPFMTHINSYMFRHEGVIFRGLL
jgi:hypothetical protein